MSDLVEVWQSQGRRYAKALNIYFQQTLGLQEPVDDPFQLSELSRLIEKYPRLDPAIMAQHNLVQNIKVDVASNEITFCDASLELVRAASRAVPDFWNGL